MYKIYIFMQCAPDPYEFFQSIFGLRALSKCVHHSIREWVVKRSAAEACRSQTSQSYSKIWVFWIFMHGCPWIAICMQQLGVFGFHCAFSRLIWLLRWTDKDPRIWYWILIAFWEVGWRAARVDHTWFNLCEPSAHNPWVWAGGVSRWTPSSEGLTIPRLLSLIY